MRRFVDDVVGQLRRGTPFAIAATQFSQAQTALQGGDLGWVRKEEVDPEVAAVLERMPPGAISNAIRVPGGFQIVALRQRRETGRDMATMISMRQAFFPFAGTLDPNNPTQQQRDQVEKAQKLAAGARSCEAVEQAARGSGGDRPVDPGTIRLETVNPPPLRSLLAGLSPGKASQPILTPDGVLVMMVCSREQRNLAEIHPGGRQAADPARPDREPVPPVAARPAPAGADRDAELSAVTRCPSLRDTIARHGLDAAQVARPAFPAGRGALPAASPAWPAT